MAKVVIRQGEAKLLPFRIKDRRTGRPMPLPDATFLMWVKWPGDPNPVIVKIDSDFDKNGVLSGYLTCFLEAQETIQPAGRYEAELRVMQAGTPTPIEKIPFDFEVLEAVTPNDFTVEVVEVVSLEAFGEPTITNS